MRNIKYDMDSIDVTRDVSMFTPLVQFILTNTEKPKTENDQNLSFKLVTDKFRYNDVYQIYKNSELLNDLYYRFGGLSSIKNIFDRYFMLLEYKEDKTFSDGLNHGNWVIMDSYGVIHKKFELYQHAYLIKDSVLYSLNGKLYNIITDECYGYGKTMVLENSVILHREYTEQSNNALVINKVTGETYTIK